MNKLFELSNPILAHFCGKYPDVFCAGGFVVDHLMGVEPKDIDLFTFIPLRSDEGTPMHEMTQEKLDIYEVGANGNVGRIVAVRRFEGYTLENGFKVPLPIELVQLHPHRSSTDPYGVADSVREFSFGIQQAWLSPENGYPQFTPAFWEDYTKERITVTHCKTVEDAKRLNKKLRRIQEKYGIFHWPLICGEQWKPIIQLGAALP